MFSVVFTQSVLRFCLYRCVYNIYTTYKTYIILLVGTIQIIEFR